MTKQVGLTIADLEIMTIGMVLDYTDEYIASMDPKKKKEATRKAGQADYDSF